MSGIDVGAGPCCVSDELIFIQSLPQNASTLPIVAIGHDNNQVSGRFSSYNLVGFIFNYSFKLAQ
jgi:hypothetical protein